MTAKHLSAGILLHDGARLLMAHPTGQSHWDIPKGHVEPGETPLEGALRELQEETGLILKPDGIETIGHFVYRSDKDVFLHKMRLAPLPDPASLVCVSTFTLPDGRVLPENDAFALVPFGEVVGKAAPRMGKILAQLLPTLV